jgi:hypothetical protein
MTGSIDILVVEGRKMDGGVWELSFITFFEAYHCI